MWDIGGTVKLLKNSNCPKFNFHPFGGEKQVEPNQIHLYFKSLGLTDMCGAIAVTQGPFAEKNLVVVYVGQRWDS